jgi:hypothetical protein
VKLNLSLLAGALICLAINTPAAIPAFRSITVQGPSVVIEYTGEGALLQSSPGPAGPWTSIEGASSPHVAQADAPLKLFRLVSGDGFSRTLVGYAKVPVTKGYSILGFPFGAKTLDDILPATAFGSAVHVYRNGQFATSIFLGSWFPNLEIKFAEGFFFHTDQAADLIFAGEVPQGSFQIPVPAGFSLLGNPIPKSGEIQNEMGFPDFSTIFWWRNDSYMSDLLIGGSSPGPIIRVADGFWVMRDQPATWRINFTVDP